MIVCQVLHDGSAQVSGEQVPEVDGSMALMATEEGAGTVEVVWWWRYRRAGARYNMVTSSTVYIHVGSLPGTEYRYRYPMFSALSYIWLIIVRRLIYIYIYG